MVVVVGAKGMEGLGEGKAAVAGLTLRDRCEVVKSALSPPPVLPLPHLIIPLLFLPLCRFPYRLFLHSQSFQPFLTGALLPLLLFVFTFFFLHFCLFPFFHRSPLHHFSLCGLAHVKASVSRPRLTCFS